MPKKAPTKPEARTRAEERATNPNRCTAPKLVDGEAPEEAEASPLGKLLYSPDDLIRLGVCRNRNAVYLLLASGELVSWKQGKARNILPSSVTDYIARRAAEATK